MDKDKLEWFKKHRETKKKDDIGNAWILLEVDDYDWLLKAVEDQHRDIMRIKKAFKEKCP